METAKGEVMKEVMRNIMKTGSEGLKESGGILIELEEKGIGFKKISEEKTKNDGELG